MLKLLIFIMVGSIGLRAFAADPIYLSDSQKAMIGLILKSTQEISEDLHSDRIPSEEEIAERSRRVHQVWDNYRNRKAEEPRLIRVKSYEEFLAARKMNPIFEDYFLTELQEQALLDLLGPVKYVSDSVRVQRKIDDYEDQRRQMMRGFIQSLGLNGAELFQVLTERGLKDVRAEIKKSFAKKVEDVTAKLDQSSSVQVTLLKKLMKAYFKNLPYYQKLEILYRISLMPMNSEPLDVFLTMIQNAGPQMQKLIQIMGRNEHVPQEFQDVFQRLESGVRKVAWWKAKLELESLGIDFSEFTYFEREPIGVGTMAQTHRAQYIDENGERQNVVIRFLKPNVAEYLEMDHQILKKIAFEIDEDPELKVHKLPSLADLVDDLHRSVVEELNIADTVKQQTRGRHVYNRSGLISFNGQKNYLKVNVPDSRLYKATNGVMVQELVIGKKPAKEFSAYKELYPDLYRAMADEVAAMWLDEAFFKSGFFHADLHQGNLMASVTDDAVTVHILDFGMVGQLEQKVRESALLLALGIRLDKPELIATHFLRLGDLNEPGMTPEVFTAKVRERIQQMRRDPSLNGSLEAWTAWAMDNGLALHYEFLKLNRGLTAIEGLLSDSKSRLSITSLAQKLALKNKAYVTRLVMNEPNLKISDLAGLIGSTFGLQSRPQTAGPLQCRSLFN